jgi:hypothetical protein
MRTWPVFWPKKSWRKMSRPWPGSATAGTAPLGSPCRDGATTPDRSESTGRRVPIEIPRLRDKNTEEEHTLESYQAMKEAEVGQELTDSILLGLSQGDYGRVASQFVDGFGLSQSSVSRRFQKRAQKALEEFESRSLEEENFLALWLDGKHVAGEQMIICMGVTEAGYKKVLGFTQATTERHEPIVELLRDLLDRGLSVEEGILCVVDGGRGLRKATREVFSGRAEVQRCQWHKRKGRAQLPAEDRSEKNGAASSNGPTRSRPTRPPKSGSPVSMPSCSRSTGTRPILSWKGWKRRSLSTDSACSKSWGGA